MNYQTGIKNAGSRELEVTFGGAIIERVQNQEEVICWLPRDVTEQIQNSWHTASFYVNRKGQVCFEFRFSF